MSHLSPIISTATVLAFIGWQGVAYAETQSEPEEVTALQVQAPTDPSPALPSNGEEAPSPAPPEMESPQQQMPEGDAADEPEVLVVEVDVEGVEGELEDIVFDATDIQPGRITTRSRLQEDVNAIFATGLFSNVRVVPEDTPLGVRVTFVVEPNPTLEEVQVNTLPADQEERVLPDEVVDEIFRDQYGELLNFQELQNNIEQLNQWYQENGYDLAQVVDSPEVSEDGVVTITVAEGVIEDIQVRLLDETGEEIDGRTRDFIITREVELSPGDVFRRQTARADLERVFGLGIFEDGNLSFEPGDDPSKVVLNFEMVEGDTGSIGAGAGVSSATGLFGTVSYQEQNLGGNNQNLSTELQVGGRTLLFNARFQDPWIAGDPYRTSYTADLFRRRSLSVIFDGGETNVTLPDGDTPRVIRTGGGVEFARPLAPDPFTRAEWNVSAGLNYQRVQIEDSDGQISPRDEDDNQLSFDESGRDDLVVLELGARRDLRDNPRQPTSGSVLRLGVDQSVPIGSGSIFFNRLEAGYSQFFPVDWTNFADGAETLAFNVQAGTVFGDLPPYEAFSLGGTNSVRGYQQGDVGAGRSFLQATAEYRFPVFDIIGGALFVDVGTDLGTGSNVPGQPAEVRDKPGSGFGYGLGVRVDSPLGPLRLDYGINDQGDNRIHFGIGERF
ncbi:BamA/TamA family outer membrane protein [Euhalothece natronophila Z-M001]|uniref:BamA/TamA family outer membrane protein n=1 Tax=Euhalothece natronophila Z-M001 TaxID=522448 RepID=A0A5B8NP89_9CHRO|nr:BamA/TamA family outer membrane protein [Euhalothece natronophila]QDZ41082.1 BamA/TamA family outer membrane protein [Euhalothece natronophila Z-M001]